MVSSTSKAAGRKLAEFVPLKSAEQKLLDACRRGEVAIISEKRERPTKPTEENTVRASFLRFLALGGDEDAQVHEKGVQLWEAWVDGELDLQGTTLPNSLSLAGCHLNIVPILRDSNVQGFVGFHGCHVEGLMADYMVCSGSVYLSDGFTSVGEVNLAGAKIGGDFGCDTAKFDGKGGYALLCERAEVQGSVFLRDSISTGTVRLQGMHIGGSLECDSGKFNGMSNAALICESTIIKGSVFLRNEFNAAGIVLLLGAQIGGDLDCSNGKFHGNGGDAFSCEAAIINGNVLLGNGFISMGTVRLLGVQIAGSLDCRNAVFNDNGSDVALICDRAEIKGGVFFTEGFSATGTVRLLSAQIGGSLECDNGKFDGKRSDALSCDSVVIKGNVFFRNDFTAIGAVRLPGAKISGDLECSNGAMFIGANGEALAAQSMVVSGAFFFRDLRSEGIISLIAVKVSSLVDDVNSWPKGLELDGFVYDRLAGTAPTDAETRLKWLDKQIPSHAGLAGGDNYFRPQPWQQLQKVLRNMGHLEDARLVGIAFEKRRHRANLVDYPNLHRLDGLLLGYGYRSLRLFYTMLAVWLLCGVFYWNAARYGDNGNGVFAPSNPLVFQNPEYAACVPASLAAKLEGYKLGCGLPSVQGAGNWYLCKDLREEYTGFSPFAYSLDLILPLVDLQQEHDWAPMIPTRKTH